MRLGTAFTTVLALSLAACGAGNQEGIVKFRGSTPNTALQKTKMVREFETFCPNCGKPLAFGATKCPDRRTCEGQKFTWATSYVCGSCKGTGQCGACMWMDQPDGQCYNCRGKGDLILEGQARECPNCKGKKVCPICDGSKKCDFCKGDKKVGAEVVKAHLKKGSLASGDEPPPSDERKEDKKTEPKKEEPKPEDKKDEKKEEKKEEK